MEHFTAIPKEPKLLVISIMVSTIGCRMATQPAQTLDQHYSYESKNEIVPIDFIENDGKIAWKIAHLTKKNDDSREYRTSRYIFSGLKLHSVSGYSFTGQEIETKEPEAWTLTQEVELRQTNGNGEVVYVFQQGTELLPCALLNINHAIRS